MNEINYIKVSNGPLARGKPLIAVIPKDIGLQQRACHPEGGTACPVITGTEVPVPGLLCSNFEEQFRQRPLLKMRDGPVRHAKRDGPRNREPDIGLAPNAVAAGVPVALITYLFVSLCVLFEYFVAKMKTIAAKTHWHTGIHEAITGTRNSKTFRMHCIPLHARQTGVYPFAGEKSLVTVSA